MKLLYITNGINGSGGLERVLSVKASYFAEVFNYDVNILTLNDGDKNIFFDFSNKINFHDIKINRSNPITFILSYKSGIKKIIKKLSPDIIIVCDDGLKGMLFPIIFGKKIPTIYERHVSKNIEIREDSPSFLNKIKNDIKFKLMDYGADKFSKFVVLTNGNKNEWNLNNLEVISNPLPYKQNEISDLNSKTILVVGKQSYQKGYDRLLDIWQIVSSKYPDWKIEVYGKLDSSLQLEKKAQMLNISNSITFYLAVKNIEDKYKTSSIYLMTSRFEGFGMVLIEAMSFGVPCVSFDCPHGPSDIISNNIDGFIIENGNINEFANKLMFLIENENKRLEFGTKALSNVKRFDIDNIAIEWKKLFEGIVK